MMENVVLEGGGGGGGGGGARDFSWPHNVPVWWVLLGEL